VIVSTPVPHECVEVLIVETYDDGCCWQVYIILPVQTSLNSKTIRVLENSVPDP